MPTWLIIILIVAIIGAIIGFLTSKDGERGEGAAAGALTGAVGCGYVLFQLLIWGLGIWFVIWIFSSIFG